MRTLHTIAAGALLVSAGASAAPTTNPNAPERTDAFVCPVISTENVTNSPRGHPLGDTGDYTIGGPTLKNGVPIRATNGDGTGVPEGEHSRPGDSDYTAIWSVC